MKHSKSLSNEATSLPPADTVSVSGPQRKPYVSARRLHIDRPAAPAVSNPDILHEKVDMWTGPCAIVPNNFTHKSLSNWAYNPAVGCAHACRFCYVPSASTIKQGPKLATYGVRDPDAEWGDYVSLRPWDERKFLASLRAAENTPREELKADGNRAVIFSSTTDPYQVIKHPDPVRQRELQSHFQFIVRRALELIRDHSTLRVRILTRSPLSKVDFDLFKSFGNRLLFGMSLPTLRNDYARLYEPHAPAPTQRLATLRAAKEAGLHVFVAMAPTFPECDEDDLRATLTTLAELDPVTVFHEPINIRAENVQRIEVHARNLGLNAKTEVFASRQTWQDYALDSLRAVARISKELELDGRLHLWPDRALGVESVLIRQKNPRRYAAWLEKCWGRISEWPR